jgi:malic enzyme
MIEPTTTFDLSRREVRTALRGYALLRDPLLNKSTAFPHEERAALGLEGLLPGRVATLEEQLVRVGENYDRVGDDLDRYVYLRALQDRNETLFYAFVLRRLEELVPIVYTPTVGTAVQRFSHIYQRPRGLHLCPDTIGHLPRILRRYPGRADVRLIVVTDSEGILGIGDQGTGGMGIPIGKLALYVLGAGIHPAACLPVALDVGTNNPEHLGDPLYLGWRRDRLRGDAYSDFMERFVSTLEAELPGVLVQWEDFSKQNAFTVLDKYRSRLPSFNDDIQGTGAVILGGVLAALRITGQRLCDQRIVVHGAGAGGIGVAHRLCSALVRDGLAPDEARERIFALDSRGLLVEGRQGVEPYKTAFAHRRAAVEGWTLRNPDRIALLDVIENAKPTVLLGTSGTPGEFDESVVRAMAAATDQPIIFPLSNPTARAEAAPQDVYRWTEGRAVVATGSPFPPVTFDGRTNRVGQANNVFVFPGIGLGALVAGASEITDDMVTAAAAALVECVSEEDLRDRCVYPRIGDLREVTVRVAGAVVRAAIREAVAPPIAGDVEETVRASMWAPEYFRYVAV